VIFESLCEILRHWEILTKLHWSAENQLAFLAGKMHVFYEAKDDEVYVAVFS
jgi:hypothetical protein